MRTIVMAVLAASVSLGTTGCLKKMMLDGQIEATREAAPSVDTLGDYELARSAVAAGLAQFEGMHRLAPDNADALYLLTKGWAGYGYAFAEDDLEVAQDSRHEPTIVYHRMRTKLAYDRAIAYGTELIGKKAKGFDDAKKSHDSLGKWLAANFRDASDSEILFWTGYAWMARVNVMIGDAEIGAPYVAGLFVGVDLVERSVVLDATAVHHSGQVALAAYHIRTALSEPEESKKLFELALAKTARKSLTVQFTYATKYACTKHDQDLYGKLLHEVLDADDPDPQQRLANAVAKRRASRWLGKARVSDNCGFEPPAPPQRPSTADSDS
ncbi:MAG: TRAP transporter TatT component family protein [Myxococcales bacterium]